ncbi:MAG: hypothetical protein AAGC93_31180, partial [Cyanobacteria bacterium P01_F01_bin.53]
IDSPAHNDFDPVPQAPSAPTVPPVLAPPAAPAPAKQPTSRDVAEIVGLFQELKAALPEAEETTIRAFSSTLFMQRRKEEPEF